MGTLESYYRILGLDADASIDEIREALHKMRTLDEEGNYTAILNKIEKTLLPKTERKKIDAEPFSDEAIDDLLAENNTFMQDRAARSADRFLDFGEDDFDAVNGQKQQEIRDPRRFLTAEEIAAYNRPPSKWAKIFSLKTFLWLIVLSAATVAGVVLGLPFYNHYLAAKQADEAYPVLERAKNEVDAFIRKKGYFPDAISPNNSDFYTITLNKDKEAVVLTFSPQASELLRGNSMTMQGHLVPSLGLQWRCGISTNFPKELKPSKCY